jgi:hypothetical protein
LIQHNAIEEKKKASTQKKSGGAVVGMRLKFIRTLFANLLVDMEVKGELGVVLLDNDASGLLDRLGSDASLLFPKQNLVNI